MFQTVILCVDDERLILDNLLRQLEEAFGNNYLYEFAENAEDALELLDELDKEGLKVVAIISDWLMPGIKGDELLIRVHEKFPQMIKILLSGQADEAALERAKQYAKLHCCIYKPWSEKELVETLKQGLEKL